MKIGKVKTDRSLLFMLGFMRKQKKVKREQKQ